ncbi:hypothetical protein O9929_13030 [Vibrio lentus]|nr:hypothetical protein [Vibrio lentus]
MDFGVSQQNHHVPVGAEDIMAVVISSASVKQGSIRTRSPTHQQTLHYPLPACPHTSAPGYEGT